MPIPQDMLNEGKPGCFGSPKWHAANVAEIASRPKALNNPGPITPDVLALHRQRGAAARGKNKAEVMRLDALIAAAERERRAAAQKRG